MGFPIITGFMPFEKTDSLIEKTSCSCAACIKPQDYLIEAIRKSDLAITRHIFLFNDLEKLNLDDVILESCFCAYERRDIKVLTFILTDFRIQRISTINVIRTSIIFACLKEFREGFRLSPFVNSCHKEIVAEIFSRDDKENTEFKESWLSKSINSLSLSDVAECFTKKRDKAWGRRRHALILLESRI